VISAGFLLLKPVPRPPYVSVRLMPDTVVSAGDCICPQFPGPYAIEWCISTDEERVASLALAGVPSERHAAAIAWATAACGKEHGWPGIFYTVDAAREARRRFIAEPELMKVIGLGLPEQFASSFMENAAPPASPPGYAPNGESGYLECVRRREALPDGGRILGFEPLSLELGMLGHSWLCNGLEEHCYVALQIHPSANGLLGSLEAAIRCCAEIERDEVGAEPGPWYPFLLVEY
jgi:hypothetical protein